MVVTDHPVDWTTPVLTGIHEMIDYDDAILDHMSPRT
jgi:hypothetical protein